MAAFPAEIPVVIVGGGPCGLTTANLLASYGVECIVLELEPAPLNLPRAIVLDDEGARTLQVFGMDETYLADTREGVGSKYYDDQNVCFAETGKGPRNFGFAKRHFIFQPELETALRDRLQEQSPGVLRFSAEVCDIDQSGEITLVRLRDADGEIHTIQTQWVLACDGGKSPIREKLGIPMIGNTYEQDWIVIDTKNDPDTGLFSKFFCSSERPSVSVPASQNGRRYEFMVLPGETREQVLEDEFLANLLAPHRPYDPSEIIRKTVYTFHARIAETFRNGRILLLGDAAHLTPPFAGQGMNAGFRDAFNVAWKIACIVNGGANAAILDSYDTERRKPAWDMIQLAVAMGNIVMPAGRDQLVFRDLLLKALEPFPSVRDYLIQMRFKPKPRCDAGLFLDIDTQMFEASLVGEMIPQPFLKKGTHLDSALGKGFALIAQNAAGQRALAALDKSEILGLPLSKITLNSMNSSDAGLDITVDEIMRPLLTHRDQILLVRPDRYCAAAVFPDDLAALITRYEALFS
jgi:3-(3-hydroxy-phenyl)propionate hydroxylase